MLNAVQIIHYSVCSQCMRPLCNKATSVWKLYNQLLELATVDLYGHDGEWLNCLAIISRFVNMDPVRPENSGVFVFSL